MMLRGACGGPADLDYLPAHERDHGSRAPGRTPARAELGADPHRAVHRGPARAHARRALELGAARHRPAHGAARIHRDAGVRPVRAVAEAAAALARALG